MVHGGYANSRAAGERKKPAAGNRNKPAAGNRKNPKSITVNNKSKKAQKPKAASLKHDIRSIERFLRKDLPPEVKEAQEKKLEGLKKQQETQNRLAMERKIFIRNKKIVFFERRKIDRRIRQLEKQQLAAADQDSEIEIANQLSKLKEDLEYVRFFPKAEKYVPLFMGGDETEIVEKRNSLRKKIKENLIAAAESGKVLEETGREEDVGLLDPTEDDFFLDGSSSDEADAVDETTDKNARKPVSSVSGKATSEMSSDQSNQRNISAGALMPPPPGPFAKPFPTTSKNKPRIVETSNKKPYNRAEISKFSSINQSKDKPRFAETSGKNSYNSRYEASGYKSYNGAVTPTSSSINQSSFRNRAPVDFTTENYGNLSSNSEARKPKRKRRPKKKKTS